jgi:hypothetical protein
MIEERAGVGIGIEERFNFRPQIRITLASLIEIGLALGGGIQSQSRRENRFFGHGNVPEEDGLPGFMRRLPPPYLIENHRLGEKVK